MASDAPGREHSTDSDDETASEEPVTDATRRRFLAACGALPLATSFAQSAAGEGTAGTAPETLDGFEAAVDETLAEAQATIDEGPYDPTWDSLGGVDPAPEWFRDAKFGVYLHWGLYSVPAYDSEWYPRNMYDVDGSVYEHHVENYGEPTEYPYEDFADEFTADAFDPEEWTDLFERAGARFAGLVAKHADGWSNWDSAINPWNAADMGPERDVTSELGAAVRDRDLRFVTTFHHAYKFGYDYYEYAFQNFESLTEDYPENVLYGNLDADLFWSQWLAEVVETLEGNESDLVYFDSGLDAVPEDRRQQFLAYYYNQAASQDRDVVATHKQSDLPLETSVEDYEEGGRFTIADQAWLVDVPISTYSWGYVDGQEYKSVEEILDILVDSVSKNGQLMLNLSPKADGTIPEAQRERLRGVGDWLDIHGEAVYETRPWELYGTGPNWGEGFTADDVRYTQSKDGETVYAIVMGWPDADAIALDGTYVPDPSNAPSQPPGHGGDPPGKGDPNAETGPGDVRLLGHGSVSHDVDDAGHLRIDVPDLDESERPSESAVAFAISDLDLRGVTADYILGSSDIYAARVAEGVHEVTVTVYNFARGESPPTTVRVENVTTGTTIGEADVDAMSLYGNTEATVEWDTSDLEDGTEHELRAVVDPDDEVPEQNESNNAATATVEIPAWPVDLVPKPVRVADIEPGNSVDVAVEVANRGTAESAETTATLLDVTGDDETVLTEFALPPVAAGDSETMEYTWDVSEFETGTARELRAVVDPDDAVPERDESNNATEPATVRLFGPVPEGYQTTASTDAVFGTWDDNLVVSANGADVWDDVDEYGALYDPGLTVTSGSTAVVRVVAQEVVESWSKAGLVVRNDVTAAGESAGYAAVMVTGDNGFEFEWDSDANGYVDSSANTGESTRPCWLRLGRDGSTFTASFSTDGENWTEIGTADVPEAAAEQDVAMFVTSHGESTRSTVEFDQFEVR